MITADTLSVFINLRSYSVTVWINRVRLSKRRSKKGVAANRSTFLAVKHREMEPDELTNQVGCYYTIPLRGQS